MTRDEEFNWTQQEVTRLTAENDALRAEIASLKAADESTVESLGQIEANIANLDARLTALEPAPAP